MKLVRIQNAAPDLSRIKGEEGEDLTDEGIGKHVATIYPNLYARPEHRNAVDQNKLKEFLGNIQACEQSVV
jgi:hypothetical protein